MYELETGLSFVIHHGSLKWAPEMLEISVIIDGILEGGFQMERVTLSSILYIWGEWANMDPKARGSLACKQLNMHSSCLTV